LSRSVDEGEPSPSFRGASGEEAASDERGMFDLRPSNLQFAIFSLQLLRLPSSAHCPPPCEVKDGLSQTKNAHCQLDIGNGSSPIPTFRFGNPL
jgi:hypothetical protein